MAFWSLKTKEINEVVEGSNLYKPSATLEQLVLPEVRSYTYIV